MGTSLKKVAKKAKDYKYVLMVMRHAKTEPFGNGGDAGRELTDKGRKQAKSVAKGLASFTTRDSTRIATIPVGYADGYPRSLSNKGYVLINGKKAPIIGRVCTKAACNPCSTNLRKPRRNAAHC